MTYPYYNPVNYNPSFIPQSNNNGIIWVQGEAGAKAYPITPNARLLLMDSEAQRFYIKTTDVSGIPMPLRVFEYNEITNLTQNKANEGAEAMKEDEYITRNEFERIMADFVRKEDIPKRLRGEGRTSEVKDDE